MKTKMKVSNFKRAILYATLLWGGIKVNAQCVASYTSVVNPANNGGVTFSYTGTWLGMGLSTYFWDFGDGGTCLMSNPGNHTYTTSGTYNACVTLTDPATSCSNTYCSTISVVNSTGSATCSASFVAYDSVGYTYFQNTSTGSSLISNWTFGDSYSGVSTGDITHTFSSSPYGYYVCLYVSDTNGTCTSYFCDTVNYVNPMGISENELASTMALYPNPTTGDLNIDLTNAGDLREINIFDLQGRIVHSEEAKRNTNSQKVSVADLVNGIYFIEFVSVDGKTTTGKFIKN